MLSILLSAAVAVPKIHMKNKPNEKWKGEGDNGVISCYFTRVFEVWWRFRMHSVLWLNTIEHKKIDSMFKSFTEYNIPGIWRSRAKQYSLAQCMQRFDSCEAASNLCQNHSLHALVIVAIMYFGTVFLVVMFVLCCCYCTKIAIVWHCDVILCMRWH